MKDNHSKPFELFCRYAKRQRTFIVRLSFIYIASTALLILAPQTLSHFIDSVQSGDAWQGLLLAILLYLAAMLAQTAMSAVLDYQLASVGQRLTDDYRLDTMTHFLSLDAQRLTSLTSGEVITRLDEDVQGLFKYYYILFYKLAGSALALIGILAALFLRAGWLSASLLVISILAILGFKAIQDRGIPKYVRRAKAAAEFNGIIKEMLDNAPVLRALCAEDYADGQTQQAMKQRFRESFPANLMYANLWSASTIMQGLVIGSGLALTLLLWDTREITLGVAYLIYTYSELIIRPLQDFRNHMGGMQDAKAGILRSQEFLQIPVTVRGGEAHLGGGSLELIVEDVRFAYASGEETLCGVSFTLPAGERMGIRGETGCGKSTLMSLIARLNDFDSGVIKLGGVDIREISLSSLRQRVAYCTQHVQLIHGTIRDNIIFYDPRFSDEDIWEAVDFLGLSEWFKKFPNGLNTNLEMGEGNLSSGEAQLIALIRLALRKPGLVLLDEITSKLDAVTERNIIHAMESLCRGRTVLAIAHNAEALGWMDKIMHMEKGVLCTPEKKGRVLCQ